MTTPTPKAERTINERTFDTVMAWSRKHGSMTREKGQDLMDLIAQALSQLESEVIEKCAMVAEETYKHHFDRSPLRNAGNDIAQRLRALKGKV